MLLHVHLFKVCLYRCWSIGLEYRDVVRVITGDILVDVEDAVRTDAVLLLGVDLRQHAGLARLGDRRSGCSVVHVLPVLIDITRSDNYIASGAACWADPRMPLLISLDEDGDAAVHSPVDLVPRLHHETA